MTAFSFVLYAALVAFIGIAAEKWEDFRVLYSPLPVEGQGVYQIERVESKAIEQGWVPISNDCFNGGKFNGFRYVYNDNGIQQYDRVVLFDIQGTIAGYQILLPQSAVLSSLSTIQLEYIPMYQNETFDNVEYFVLTSYFQNPDTICTVGRSVEQLESNGTGDGLWFQNGISPADLIQAPLVRSAAIAKGWTKNACFFQMGFHNFYQVETWDSTSCNQVRPAFLLYNHNDELIAFGFVSPGKLINKYFENVIYMGAEVIVSPNTPDCLRKLTDNGLVSQHIFFRSTSNQFVCST